MRHRLLKAVGYLSYVPPLGFAAFLSLVRIAIYSYFLSVGDFGLLTKLLLISALFGTVGSFGFQWMAQRDLPVLFAEGRYREGLFSLCKAVIVTTSSALLMSVCSLWNFPVLGVSGFFLCCGIVHGWSQQIFMLAAIDTRSRLEMMRYAKQVLFRTVAASVVAIGVAVSDGGPVGIVLAETIVTLLIAVRLISTITRDIAKLFLWKNSMRNFKKSDFSAALLLFAGTSLAFFSVNIDRWLAAEHLEYDDFGQYAFAWISLTGALSIQAFLNSGIFPLISRKRKEGKIGAAFKTTAYISFATFFSGSVIAIVLYLFAQWFIPIGYQQYAPALPLIMPLLLAAILRLADFWSSYLIMINRQNLILGIQIFLVLISFLYYSIMNNYASFAPLNFAWLAMILAVGNYVMSALAAVFNRKEG